MIEAQYVVTDHIAVITLYNPPVNGLGFELRTSLLEKLNRANSDKDVQAILLIGANDVFCAGADIRQMNTQQYWSYPRTIDLTNVLDEIPKLSVAIIGKFAMGGGMELALGCHYRMCWINSKLAQPEINLGLLPGGGGILRLPRLLGLETASHILLNGQTIDGETALKIGLVDALAQQSTQQYLLDSGLAWTRKLLNEDYPLRRICDMNIKSDNSEELFNELKKTYCTSYTGLAPRVIIKSLEQAIVKSFEETLIISDQATAQLMSSVESEALRYLFFAQRDALKVDSAAFLSTKNSLSVYWCGPKDKRCFNLFEKNSIQCEYVSTDVNHDATSLGSDVLIRSYEHSNLVEVVTEDYNHPTTEQLIKNLKHHNKIPIYSKRLISSLMQPMLESFLYAYKELIYQGLDPQKFQQQLDDWGFEFALPSWPANPTSSQHFISFERSIQELLKSVDDQGTQLISLGHALHKSDLDLVWVLGYRFPAFRGGPFFRVESAH